MNIVAEITRRDKEVAEVLERLLKNYNKENSPITDEDLHYQADDALVQLLTELGFYKTVDAYNKIYPKYYS